MKKSKIEHGIIEHHEGNLALVVLGKGEQMKVRDYQRSRVYAFDDAARDELIASAHETMSLEECAMLASKILEDYGEAMVMVGDGRGRSHACALWNANEIRLPKYHRNPEVVIHEVAHILVMRWFGKKVSSHGGEFVGVMCRLLSEYTDLEKEWLEDKVKEMKLDISGDAFYWGHPSNVPEEYEVQKAA